MNSNEARQQAIRELEAHYAAAGTPIRWVPGMGGVPGHWRGGVDADGNWNVNARTPPDMVRDAAAWIEQRRRQLATADGDVPAGAEADGDAADGEGAGMAEAIPQLARTAIGGRLGSIVGQALSVALSGPVAPVAVAGFAAYALKMVVDGAGEAMQKGASAISNVFAQGLEVALSPLGATGGELTKLGGTLSQALTTGMARGMKAAGVLMLLAGAGPGGLIGGALLGKMAEEIGGVVVGALSALRNILKDLIDVGGRWATTVMSMHYATGRAVESSLGLNLVLSNLGAPEGLANRLFGGYMGQPWMLGARLGVMGLPAGLAQPGQEFNMLRGMGQWYRQTPTMLREPMMDAVLGSGAAQQLGPLLADPAALERAIEATRLQRVTADELRMIRHGLLPALATMRTTGEVIRTRLLAAAAPTINRVLESLLQWLRENRGKVETFFERLPVTILNATASLLEGLGWLANKLQAIWQVLKNTWEVWTRVFRGDADEAADDGGAAGRQRRRWDALPEARKAGFGGVVGDAVGDVLGIGIRSLQAQYTASRNIGQWLLGGVGLGEQVENPWLRGRGEPWGDPLENLAKQLRAMADALKVKQDRDERERAEPPAKVIIEMSPDFIARTERGEVLKLLRFVHSSM